MPFSHLKFAKHWEISPDTYYRLGQCKGLLTSLKKVPLSPKVQQELMEVSLIKGAQASTAIEGNTLSTEEVKRVREGEKLPESKEYQAQEVDNVLRAMDAISRQIDAASGRKPITPQLFQQFHRSVGKNLPKPFNSEPGHFAQSQRVVGGYRCPPHGRGSNQVEGLVERLCAWSEKEFGFAAGKQTFRDGFVQAVVTHVYFEWIHPFDDGNGRTGRLVEFYLLLRARVPDIAAHILSNHYNQTRPEYYQHLQQCQQKNDLSDFIVYAVTGFFAGINELWDEVSEELLERAWRGHVYDTFAEIKLSTKVFKRQRTLALYFPLHESYKVDDIMLCSPEIANNYARDELATLKRDVNDLVARKLLIRKDGMISANVDMLLGLYPQVDIRI